MLKKIFCIAAALCGFTGLAHGALTYTQTPALFLGGGTTGSDGFNQRVATNGSGMTVIAWVAPAVKSGTCCYKNGVFVQRYDTIGNPLGSLVSIIPGTEYALYTQAAIDPLGRFIVAWYDGTDFNYRLYNEQGELIKQKKLTDEITPGFTPFPL